MKPQIIFLSIIMASMPLHAIEVTYTQTMCRILEKHTPRDDVTYRSGIDVNGNGVVSADLNSASQFQLPDTIKIPLSVDLAQEFGLPNFTNDELVAPLGILEVTKDGRVIQDGRDLTDRAYILCKDD